jgi:hypothetical protein
MLTLYSRCRRSYDGGIQCIVECLEGDEVTEDTDQV